MKYNFVGANSRSFEEVDAAAAAADSKRMKGMSGFCPDCVDCVNVDLEPRNASQWRCTSQDGILCSEAVKNCR